MSLLFPLLVPQCRLFLSLSLLYLLVVLPDLSVSVFMNPLLFLMSHCLHLAVSCSPSCLSVCDCLLFFSLQSLDGFVFALNQEGKFLYISETVSIYLGLSQVSVAHLFLILKKATNPGHLSCLMESGAEKYGKNVDWSTNYYSSLKSNKELARSPCTVFVPAFFAPNFCKS